MSLKTILLITLLVSALLNDLLTMKIKNVIILPFFLLGLVVNAYYTGLAGLTDSLLAGVLPILILGLFFVLRMLGAGDIKLLAAIGAIMGVGFIGHTLVATAISGGIIALVIIVFRQNFRERSRALGTYLKHCLLTRSVAAYNCFGVTKEGGSFPFSCAITCGALITLLLEAIR